MGGNSEVNPFASSNESPDYEPLATGKVETHNISYLIHTGIDLLEFAMKLRAACSVILTVSLAGTITFPYEAMS